MVKVFLRPARPIMIPIKALLLMRKRMDMGCLIGPMVVNIWGDIRMI